MATETRRRRSFLWPVLLIGVGIMLLLHNLGLIAWDVWPILGRFWPVILILIGLDLILCRGNPWVASALAVFVVLAAIASGVIFTATNYPMRADGTASSQHLTQEVGQADRATVDVQFGAGDLTIAALSTDSAYLMEGDFDHSGSGRTVSQSYTCRNGTCTLRLSSRNEHNWPFGGRPGPDTWQVYLSSGVPLDLRIQAGASRIDLDLSALRASSLRLDVGASNGTIKLPQSMSNAAVIKAGAADLTVEVPEQTAARIRARGGLSSIQIDETRFPRDGDYYVSRDFATATNRVDLDLDAGVASIKIR